MYTSGQCQLRKRANHAIDSRILHAVGGAAEVKKVIDS